ncbi:hypothetical protein [Sessilibacter corallicola]|uniref:Uncharacterized protein n=1 Tax=Sessilibacter corallicola TaxID=2904075 RepID=A0ABQ0A4C8_9GAMM|nr:hypothetical protein [Sessilibacter corallicola]MCE2026976.1 hypothetical protein [Sessilibacter corallicola]
MLLKIKVSGSLVEACSLSELTDPCSKHIRVKQLRGYRNAKPVHLLKTDLVFVSGEELPNCWMEVNARGRRDSLARAS